MTYQIQSATPKLSSSSFLPGLIGKDIVNAIGKAKDSKTVLNYLEQYLNEYFINRAMRDTSQINTFISQLNEISGAENFNLKDIKIIAESIIIHTRDNLIYRPNINDPSFTMKFIEACLSNNNLSEYSDDINYDLTHWENEERFTKMGFFFGGIAGEVAGLLVGLSLLSIGITSIAVMPVAIGLFIGCLLSGAVIGYGLGAGIQNLVVGCIEKKVSGNIKNTNDKVDRFFAPQDPEVTQEEWRDAELPTFEN